MAIPDEQGVANIGGRRRQRAADGEKQEGAGLAFSKAWESSRVLLSGKMLRTARWRGKTRRQPPQG